MRFFRFKKKSRSEAPRKRSRRDGEPSRATVFFETSQVIRSVLFFGFTLLVLLIGFIGLSKTLPPVVTGQRAQTRVVAEFSFAYESQLARDEKIREARTKVPPVHRLSFQPYRDFFEYMGQLEESLQILELQIDGLEGKAREEAIATFSASALTEDGFGISPAQVETLLRHSTAEDRKVLFAQALEILRNLYQDGIYEQANSGFSATREDIMQFTVIDPTGQPAAVGLQPVAEATFELNQQIRALASAQTARALFGVFRTGLQSNLIYDLEATEASIREAELAVAPVFETVVEGVTILEPGTVVTERDQEKLKAYREEIIRREKEGFAFDSPLIQKFILILAVSIVAVLYIRISDIRLGRQNRRLALCITAILINLGLIRLILEIGETTLFSTQPAILAILPFVAPVALASLLVTLLIGARYAILTSIIVSLFYALMQGGTIEPLFAALVSSFVAVFFCLDVRKRSTVVKAGTLAGVCMALSAAFLGLLQEVNLLVIAQQMAFGLLAGILTGIIGVGMLPVLENIFKVTTQITLLELTDFNHPLLRRMQVEAPGSYHHSLMVANLAENAAANVGANPLVCRVGSLFHDIGKLVKPEYFTENQRGGINPHLAQNPSMSALVIKAHVKEGVQLARQHKLPRILMEIIRQHHGTSLIQYFYYEALKKRKSGSTSSPFPEAPTIKAEEVDESTYRYDGPKPKFKESAIIFFADSVEAASRSLKKVTPLAIDELLDRIFQDRLEDGQLDDCPITFKEITQIKKSFSFTLLNMLHTRIEYPKMDETPEPKVIEPSVQDAEEEDPLAETEAPRDPREGLG